MKHLKKIFFLLMVLSNVSNTQAQALSDADAKIVKAMQAGIINLQLNIKNNYAVQKKEEVSKLADGGVVYKASPTNNMHADDYVVISNSDNNNLLYACAYRDEHLIELLNIAANNMGKDVSLQWSISNPKSEENSAKKYILFNKVAIASFVPNTAEKELIVYFGKIVMN